MSSLDQVYKFAINKAVNKVEEGCEQLLTLVQEKHSPLSPSETNGCVEEIKKFISKLRREND